MKPYHILYMSENEKNLLAMSIDKRKTFDVTLDVKGTFTNKKFFGFQLITEKKQR